MKKIQLFLQGAIIFMLACTAYLCGAYVTEYRNIQQDNESTVATIAVVNTDNGVTADGEYINYAEKLISYPDVNFEAASLTEAREGIENDRYAAFILIPGTFSESIQSVNTKPQKANITYAVNSNLREDVKIKTVNDIHNFILNLSTNISYIYVDSILKEVHAVQDDSDAIMENDTKDMDDRAGNLIRTEDALGRTRELTYNKRGKAETIRQADGSELTFTYDAHGNTQSITDAYGTTLTYKYDALNRLVSAGDNSGQRLQLAYDRKDFVTAVTNAAGSRREYQYDENGNPVCITDFDGSIIRREYNALSLLSKETDAEGNETEYSYDTMWNIKEIKRELLFYLDPMTGESNILFQTENESTRIVGYEDGDI
ncbi:MAG TPA: hypothetical protein PLU43_02045, partial [Lachnospiraceae bacterium]|nr:hypothetical protein [Lachnospiraceae bacterium]